MTVLDLSRPDQTFEDFAAEWNLPLDQPRSREMYDEAVATATEYAKVTIPACPSWCHKEAGHGFMPTPWRYDGADRYDHFQREHSRRISAWIDVEQTEHVVANVVTVGDTRIWVEGPSSDGINAAQARKLAEDLVYAAKVYDEITAARR